MEGTEENVSKLEDKTIEILMTTGRKRMRGAGAGGGGQAQDCGAITKES